MIFTKTRCNPHFAQRLKWSQIVPAEGTQMASVPVADLSKEQQAEMTKGLKWP